MKIFLVFLFALSTMTANSSTLKIASGEYPPFSGEHIRDQGLSSQIVRAIFKEVRQDIKIEFMPWNRVMNHIENNTVAGSYPWNMNEGRLKTNYFSYPIHQYRIFAFTKAGRDFNTEKSLKGKLICLPSGWDVAPFSDMIQKLKLQVESPISIESCFQMLLVNRVDIIFMNEVVGRDVDRRLFGKKSQIVISEKSYFQKKINLHYIISKTYPDAKKIMASFNRGLERIKANGVYDSIVGFKSICETCNRLGSL